MVFEKDYQPQYREASEDGLVGMRGFFEYSQDMSTYYFKNFGLGNDTMPYEIGAGWIMVKNRIHVFEGVGFDKPLHFRSWTEPKHSKLRIYQAFEATCEGEVVAVGRSEMCIFSMKDQRVMRLSEVGFPETAIEEAEVDLGPHARLKLDPQDMEKVYSHKVRYSDLDNSRHVNNVRYVGLLMNAFTGDFYDTHAVEDFDIAYVKQCHEGDTIDVYRCEAEPNVWNLLGLRGDETVVKAQMHLKDVQKRTEAYL